MTDWLLFGAFVLTNALIYGILALGLNTQYGLAGQANFGFVALFAAGAFATTLAVLPPPGSPEYVGTYEIGFGLSWGAALLVAAATAGGVALLMGLVCLRLGGHYLAMVTFAMAQVFASFLANEEWLTKGQFGISPVPQPLRDQVDEASTYIYLYLGLAAVVTLVAYILAERAARSPFGRVLRGIREDEVAARTLGKAAGAFKLKAFVLGGVLAGLAGAVWIGSIGAVHVGQFIPVVTFNVWLAVLLGGVGNNRGVLLGAVMLVLIRESTRFLEGIPFLADLAASNASFLPSLRYIIIGLALILVVRFAPQGVLPERLRKRVHPDLTADDSAPVAPVQVKA
ncbi:MAG: branched-chain amino acid ABC transporter permease [Chloroflexota bacterium]|nr:branched-chain amino acid ABC transporter permease [Chloroflexota bacterium]